MRIGIAIDAHGDVMRQAYNVEQAGCDLVWLRSAVGTIEAPLFAAAFLAGCTSSIRVGATLNVGPHPVSIAEEAAVADLALGGRLVLGLAAGAEAPDALGETTDAVQAALIARPFRHEGARWQIPANLPQNEGWVEERLRVTPTPAQFELPLWLSGNGAAEIAGERGLSYVGAATDSSADLAVTWAQATARLGKAINRVSRPAHRQVVMSNGGVDVAPTVELLLTDRASWGLEVAILELPMTLDDTAWAAALATIMHEIRPRVQLHQLPTGTEQFWDDERAKTRDGDG